MFTRSASKKAVSIALATTMMTAGIMPLSTSFAHERHNPHAHGAQHNNWGKHAHRQFHNHYGRGYHGQEAYAHEQRIAKQRHHAHKRKKRDRNQAIAAGIIGLAIGAIIADSANKNANRRQTYTYQQPQYVQPRYNAPARSTYQPQRNYNEPEVIRFEDEFSVEPWTPGWRTWCENNYRSFNAQTGTFRGYDGRDHFCVPK